MTTDPTITCPSCQTEIKLTESLAAPLIETTKKQFEKRLADADAKMQQKEASLREREADLAKARETIDEQVASKLKTERNTIAAEEAKKARAALSLDLDQKSKEIAELNTVLKAREEKLAEAQQAQAELIRKQRELDDAKRELELTVEKRVQESLGRAREQAKKEAEEGLRLKVAEKEEVIAGMQRQIEDLKRRAEQGSQQLQGEVQELQLENLLRTKFPLDQIEPVPKGEFGGDAVHRVHGPVGQRCGSILWESKRTKHWSGGWLAKLREDQRTAKAELSILVSAALPDGVESFDHVDGVWVTSPRTAIPVAIALRQTLIELHGARQSSEGQQTKMELVYQYLTGPRFRHRVEAIVEKFSDMQADLDKERKTMTKLWAKREEQIRCVIESTAGMYGDLQGIAGKSVLEIEGLNLPRLDSQQMDSE
ncbi:hypothetical protein Pan44_19220 [Caulifigura coniformis]|uniref:Uncharacterized protein n=1 Tax=Caulifigura coniformis TaxID=2527983 RepID=A0A517SCR9_9PLAN|nr:DUF2130 domain-containing protein [Caulifigura coniformis]QDT53896.1 hypothetical protein Pan44_19220 [Caulifigura coniformis]